MVGPTDKAMLACLFKVLLEGIIAMVASFGGLHKNKVKREISLLVLFQFLPVDVSLIMGNIDTMHFVTTRNANTILFPPVAFFPAIGIRTDNEIVKSNRKQTDNNERKGIAQPNRHGTGGFLFRFSLPYRRMATGSGFIRNRSGS